MSIPYQSLALAALLFGALLLLLEAGRRVGGRTIKNDPDGARTGIGAIEGSVFGLMGLLLAFTFSGAAARLDVRRQLIVEEANAIGTAWLRLDLLPDAARDAMRAQFRDYLDSRLSIYRKLPDLAAARQELERSAGLQQGIWSRAVAAQNEGATSQAMMMLMPALNQMIDITTTRTMAMRTHPPSIIFIMLIVLSLGSALLVGYGLAGRRSRSLIHTLAFAGFVTATLYVIADLEYPRRGFIRVDDFDQVLADLRQSMSSAP